MGIFFNKEDDSAIDFSNMNHLSPEMKILIVNGQTLVEQAKKKSHEKCYDFDLTSKMQLRDDCKAVEKKIKEIGKGKAGKTDYKELENLILRLQTTLNGLLQFF